MSIQLHATGAPGPSETTAIAATPQTARADEAYKAQAQASLRVVEPDRDDTTPSRPPSEVLDQIHAASQRYEELKAQQRELHFAADPESGRVVVQVRDLEGNVLKTIPPSKALDVIAGGPFG